MKCTKQYYVAMTKSNVYIFSTYRAPSGNFMNILLKFESILKLFMKPNTEFLICGDININYLDDNYRKSQLNSFLISYNLFDTVDFPITIQKTTFSATDNILIDFSRQINFVIFPIYNCLSDGDAQLIMILFFENKYIIL